MVNFAAQNGDVLDDLLLADRVEKPAGNVGDIHRHALVGVIEEAMGIELSDRIRYGSFKKACYYLILAPNDLTNLIFLPFAMIDTDYFDEFTKKHWDKIKAGLELNDTQVETLQAGTQPRR